MKAEPGTRFLFGDECSPRSIPAVRWVWGAKGRQAKILTHTSERKSKTVFACVDARTGELCSTFADRGNSDTFAEFMGEIRKRHPDAEQKIVLVVDNVRFHKSGKSAEFAAKAGIELEYLPPHAPDLNPREWVFKDFRRALTHNHSFKTFEALIKAAKGFFGKCAAPNLLNYAHVMNSI